MHKIVIGIVCAISRLTGETLKQSIESALAAKHITFPSVDDVNAMISMILQSLHQTRVDGILLSCAELKHRLSEANLHTVIIDSSAALERELVGRLISLDNA